MSGRFRDESGLGRSFPPGGSEGGAQPGCAGGSQRLRELGHRRDGQQRPQEQPLALPAPRNQYRLGQHGPTGLQRQRLYGPRDGFSSPDRSLGKTQKEFKQPLVKRGVYVFLSYEINQNYFPNLLNESKQNLKIVFKMK